MPPHPTPPPPNLSLLFLKGFVGAVPFLLKFWPLFALALVITIVRAKFDAKTAKERKEKRRRAAYWRSEQRVREQVEANLRTDAIREERRGRSPG